MDDTKALCARLSEFPTAIAGDVLRELGHPHQILSSRIAPIARGMKLCGPAFCVRGQVPMRIPFRVPAGRRPPTYEMFDHLRPGCIMVIATGGFREAAVWGENIAITAKLKGYAGIVVDGGLRDAQAQLDSGIPTFVRFITPASSTGRWVITDYELPIVMPGQTASAVTVNPGDLILGDTDGVIVVPRAQASRAIDAATELHRIEEHQREELRRGDGRQAVYERYDRFAHIKKMLDN
ncbi:MAG: RraA family protein [Pseudomonadota bacterium]